ncbi:MAG: MBL fold metallo-hydrolase [Archaeoglobus sp.]|nr:MBL fold metallo-hydrolase [Archaeoglobus sp.]
MEIEMLRLKLPPDMPDFSTIYVLKNESDTYVIDGGYISRRSVNEVVDGLEKLDVSLRDSRFLITHHHIDHVGITIWKKVNAWMHPLEIPFLKLYTDPLYFAKPYMEWMRKYDIDYDTVKPLTSLFLTKKGSTAYTTGVKIEVKGKILPLEDGERKNGLRVIHTPGHSPGHLCFYLPEEKAMFAGDLVLSVTTTHIGYYPGYSTDPVGDQIKSLKKLLNYEIDTIYPAHEEVIKKPHERIYELIRHYEQRMEEIRSILDKPTRVVEIASKVSWSTGSFEELKGWGRIMAISETLAFLKRLVFDGKAREVEEDGIHYFSSC